MRNAPVAAVDLGTNTILMVVGRRTEHDTEILADEHAVVRLGEGVDAQRSLSPEAIERTCQKMKVYARMAHSLGVRRIKAWGTSALRDASNRQTLIDRIARECQVELCPLSGEGEALYTFHGARWGLPALSDYAVLDIGGGSTEVALGSPSDLYFSHSYNTGSVRLSERFFPLLPPTPSARQQARECARQTLAPLPSLRPQEPLLAVAGTALVLAAIDAGTARFDDPSLSGYYLETERVAQLSDELLNLDHSALCTMSPIGSERADIIGAGTLILSVFLEQCGLPGITVSLRGLRYGLLENMLQESDASTN